MTTTPNNTRQPKRALVFARVSKDNSQIARSVEEQVKAGEEWASREGWQIAKIIRETGSASRFSSRAQRGQWQEALNWIHSGKVDILLTWENSRATRDLGGYLQLRQSCEDNSVLWGYGGKVYDLDSRDDRFRTGLDALLAEDEAARSSERIRRAMSANAHNGKPHGKNLYGYLREYDPTTKHLVTIREDPATAAIVKEAARRILDGDSLYSVAQSFNTRGVPTRRPKRSPHRSHDGWTGSSIKQMLSMPAYAGLRQFQGEVIGKASWPALIPEETWHKLQTVLANKGPKKAAGMYERKHLLSGIAICGKCGSTMVSGRNTVRVKAGESTSLSTYRNYVCHSRAHLTISEKHLDTIVTEHILARIDEPDFFHSLDSNDETVSDERRELIAEIDENRSWLEQVRERAMQTRNLDLLFDQEARVKPRIEEASRRLRQLSSLPASVLTLAGAEDPTIEWEALTLDAKQEIVNALIGVTVGPTTRPGARSIEATFERVTISWRTAPPRMFKA